jgi:hypothetical protein
MELAAKWVRVRPAAALRTLLGVPRDVKPRDDEQAARRGMLFAEATAESRQFADALVAYETVATTWPGTASARDAVSAGGRLAMRMGLDTAQDFFRSVRAAAKTDAERAAIDAQTFRLHMVLAARALQREAEIAVAADDADTLNGVAWRIFQFRDDPTFSSLLPKATELARTAVKLSGESSEILDTLANLLAAAGGFDEAIAIEETAAAKAHNPKMRAEFERNVAAWKAAASRAKPQVPVPAPNSK